MLSSLQNISPFVLLLGLHVNLNPFARAEGIATLGQPCVGGGIAEKMPNCNTADGSLRCMSFSGQRDVCARKWTSSENGYHCTDAGEVEGETVRPGFYKFTDDAYVEIGVCEVEHWVSYLQPL